MNAGTQLELRLIGPAQLRVDGQPVNPPTRKGLALLAYLALEGAQTRRKLSLLLWGELDEEAARKNLRKELFRLRGTALEPFVTSIEDRVQPQGNWSSDLEGLDNRELLEGLTVPAAPEFEDWLEEQRQKRKEHLQQLLAQESLRLENSGHLREACELQKQLVNLEPLQESAQRQLMRLHASLGERALALERFHKLERLLQDELGLKPLPETIALARSIETATGFTPETTTTRSTPGPNLERPPLVGRDREWVWLEQAKPGLVMVLSEAGVGKTRLVLDFAQAQGQALVLRGFEGTTSTPLYAVAEGLRSQLKTLAKLETNWKREVARLLPELEPDLRSDPTSPEGRARFLEGLTQAFRLIFQENPGMHLVLDDLHWFDGGSLELIAHLLRRGEGMLATCRGSELGLNPGLESMLSTIERQGLLQKLSLEPLGLADTRALVQALSGGRAERFSKRLFEATGGNALFVLETLRGLFSEGLLQLQTDGGWTTPFDQATEDYTELPIPAQVREIALARIARLGPACGRLLEAASLATEPFRLEWLEGVTALSNWEALEALEHGLNASVLEVSGDGYRFGHDLVRRSLRDGMGIERQRLTHRKLSQNLIEAEAAPASIAAHLQAAGRHKEAINWHLKAAQAASTIFAHNDARNQLLKALELNPDATQAFESHQLLASLELSLANFVALEQHSDAMLGLATSESSRAQAHLMKARAKLYRADHAAGLEHAQLASKLEHDPKWQAEIALVQSTALIANGQADHAKVILLQALHTAQGKTRGDLHGILKVLHQQQGDLSTSIKHARAALEDYRQAHAREDELKTQAQLGQTLGQQGQSAEALELLALAVSQSRAFGFERTLGLALVLQAEEALRAGALEQAQQAVQEGLALAHDKSPIREAQFQSFAGRIFRRQGWLGQAHQAAEIALDMTKKLGPAQRTVQHLVNAELLLDLGDVQGSHEQLEQASTLIEQSQLRAYALPLVVLQARVQNESGQPDVAFEQLEATRELAMESPPEHRSTWQIAMAHAQASAGKTKAALETLRSFDGPPWLEARALALQLRIAPTPALLEQAKQIQTKIGHLECFEVLIACGNPDQAKVLLETMLEDLAATPALQNKFAGRINTITRNAAGTPHSA